MTPQIVALVPMRHDSERVRGKNYRPFAGKPLYHHIVQSLLDCELVAQVCIDTDSPTIMEDAAIQFPQVRILPRPEHLRDGMTSMNDVLLNAIAQVPSDFYLQTHSTNPLLRSATIGRAIRQFFDSPAHDSLFAVTRLQTRFYDAAGRAMNHDPNVLLRTQDLPPVYEENSNLYLFSAQTLRERGNRIGETPLLFPMERDEAWDIDEEIDFFVAEMIYRKWYEHA